LSKSGKILWYDTRDGYGQLVDESGIRYYFDSSVVKSSSKRILKSGSFVNFTINSEIKKLLCAKDVAVTRAGKLKNRETQLSLFGDEREV